jgi:hypothetical protein
VCGSDDVVYTCAPSCCFNHVCGTCRASWQLGTTVADAPAPATGLTGSDYDTTFPTAPCARCRNPVWQIAGRRELWCPSCRLVLNWTADAVRPYAG